MPGGGPQSLFLTNLAQFHNQIGNLRDGHEMAIHEARVALRRLREPLALVRTDFEEQSVDSLEKRIHKVFQALGRARDADIAQRLVQHVEARIALVPAALGYLRAHVARRQRDARRDLIRTLEATEAHAFAAGVAAARQRERWRLFSRDSWREQLRAHVHTRAAEVIQSVNHAGGVYFRNRSHSARVAIKQLRYALELADALAVPHDSGDLRPLRKAQNALGQAHDRQVFIDQLNQLTSDDGPIPQRESAILEQFLVGEIDGFQQRYMTMRDAVLRLCDDCLRPQRRLPVRAATATLAALAIGAVVRYRRAH